MHDNASLMEKHIPRLLKKQRERSGLSQRAIAKALGMSQSYLWKVETGKVVPSIRVATRLAREIGCTNEEMFTVAEWAGERTTIGPRDHSIILDLIKRAREHITIIGTVGVGIIVVARHYLQQKIESGCRVRVLLQDPRSPVFNRQANVEEPQRRNPTHYAFYGTLTSYVQLSHIWMRANKPQHLEVRLSCRYHDFSCVIIDNRIVEFNPHRITSMVSESHKRGAVAPSEYGQYVISTDDGELLSFFLDETEKLWQAAQPLDLQKLSNQWSRYYKRMEKLTTTIVDASI